MEKGIIFDMDGTLWDSSENVARSKPIPPNDPLNINRLPLSGIPETFK